MRMRMKWRVEVREKGREKGGGGVGDRTVMQMCEC